MLKSFFLQRLAEAVADLCTVMLCTHSDAESALTTHEKLSHSDAALCKA